MKYIICVILIGLILVIPVRFGFMLYQDLQRPVEMWGAAGTNDPRFYVPGFLAVFAFGTVAGVRLWKDICSIKAEGREYAAKWNAGRSKR